MEKFYDIPVLGGFGADGFSGCSKRIGPDIDKNTSSRSHPVKMTLNKRFFPGKKSVQTIIFGTQGIRKTMN